MRIALAALAALATSSSAFAAYSGSTITTTSGGKSKVERRLGLRKAPLAISCLRYLMQAGARSFDPSAILRPATVPAIKIDPKTVRSKSRTIAEAVDRAIESAIVVAAGDAKFGEMKHWIAKKFDALTYFGLEPRQKAVLRKIVREKRKAHLASIRKIESGETVLRDQKSRDSMIEFYRKEIAQLDLGLRHLDHPPRKTAKRLPDVEPEDVDGAGAQNAVFALAEKWAGWIFGRRSPATKAIRDTGQIVVAKESDLSGRNTQIVEHFAKRLLDDPIAYSDAMEFYSRLQKFDLSAPTPEKEISLFDPPTDVNVWHAALDATGGDVSRAIRALSVYGHDDVAQTFGQENVYLRLLDFFTPQQESHLYRNGAVDGLGISEGLRRRFAELAEEGKAFNERYQPKDHGDRVPITTGFRSGNYHFIGGAMLVNELFRMGNDHFLGVNLPVVIAEVAGRTYKRITMEAEYMSRREQILYRLGYPTIPIPKPPGWTRQEYEHARIMVRLHLAHLDLTHEQHLKGARWAYEQLRKSGLTRYGPDDYLP